MLCIMASPSVTQSTAPQHQVHIGSITFFSIFVFKYTYQFPLRQLPTLSIPTLSIPTLSTLTKWELTKWELTKWELTKWELTKWELTKWEVDQMGIDKVGIDKVEIDKVGRYPQASPILVLRFALDTEAEEHALPLPCIILNANRRTKTGEAWERGYL